MDWSKIPVLRRIYDIGHNDGFLDGFAAAEEEQPKPEEVIPSPNPPKLRLVVDNTTP